MYTFLCYSAAALTFVLTTFIWTQRRRKRDAALVADLFGKGDLNTLKHKHETAYLYSDLVENDGAGSWPPRARHDSWPKALTPYNDIYLELAPSLSTDEPSLDDEYNTERREDFRARMRKLLKDRVDMTEVKNILRAVEAGRWDLVDRDAYNGFYCCVSLCRHAYRWATVPVVKVAQREKFVDLPVELVMPWPYLQRHFGVTAESGNHTANVMHNFNERGERVYKTNVGRSEVVMNTEDTFFKMVYSVEQRAVPAYGDLIGALVAYEEGDRALCLRYLRNVSSRLRSILQSYYDDMTDKRISLKAWMSYVQGVQAWAAGKMENGEYVEYDGLSGNHVLFFQALDAFLGMDRYLTDEDFIRYIPTRQRNLCIAFRKHSFRHYLNPDRDTEMLEEFKSIINELKIFRATHRKRAMEYLQAPAPERMVMTAGKSVLESEEKQDIKTLLKPLDDMMLSRLRATVWRT